MNEGTADTTPLVAAILCRSVDTVKALVVEGKADVCKRSRDGSPLMYACRRGLVDICKLLIEYGAIRSDGVDNPLSKAIESGVKELVILLIKHGVSVDSRALSVAVKMPDTSLLTWLLNRMDDKERANDPVSNSGLTPLMVALLTGREEAFRVLMDFLSGVIGDKENLHNLRDAKGNDLLCLAIIGGNKELISYLVENHGFHPLLSVNGTGKKAWFLANRQRHVDAVAYLAAVIRASHLNWAPLEITNS